MHAVSSTRRSAPPASSGWLRAGGLRAGRPGGVPTPARRGMGGSRPEPQGVRLVVRGQPHRLPDVGRARRWACRRGCVALVASHGDRRRAAHCQLLRPRDDGCRSARPGHLRGTRTQARGRCSGARRRRRPRLRVEAHDADLPGPARLERDRADPRLGTAVPAPAPEKRSRRPRRALSSPGRCGQGVAESRSARCGVPQLALHGIAPRLRDLRRRRQLRGPRATSSTGKARWRTSPIWSETHAWCCAHASRQSTRGCAPSSPFRRRSIESRTRPPGSCRHGRGCTCSARRLPANSTPTRVRGVSPWATPTSSDVAADLSYAERRLCASRAGRHASEDPRAGGPGGRGGRARADRSRRGFTRECRGAHVRGRVASRTRLAVRA